MQGTVDNSSYFKRVGTAKGDAIKEFVKEVSGIKTVFDVGCNNGDLSYPLQKELGLKVSGIDLSENLCVPDDYDFEVSNIVEDNRVVLNDCTLFLSLYHHLLWACGIDEADDVFYKLLFRTKYLIFDSGNVSETSRRKYPWYKAQSKIFKNEKDLLDHFGVPYTEIGSWNIGGGKRSVVVFTKKNAERSFVVEGKYHRRRKSTEQKYGLIPAENKSEVLFRDISFRKLTLGNKTFFAKKRKVVKEEKKELDNIVDVYGCMDAESLITFYGYSEKYGLLYEWLDDFKYIRRAPLVCGDIKMKDVDIISVGGKIKYIDFER